MWRWRAAPAADSSKLTDMRHPIVRAMHLAAAARWQMHDQPRAAAFARLGLHVAAHRLNDAGGDRQAEPHAVARLLGGEERIEDPARDIRGEADAVILDRDADV